MSNSEDDATQTTREENVLTFEMYFWIVRSVCEKGVVKISDLKKLYQTTVAKDRSVSFRPLNAVLKTVNDNLFHWQGWKATRNEDRISYVNLKGNMVNQVKASQTESTLGVLQNALMYVFIATKPHAKHPGVTHEELMTYMETSLSTEVDHKLPSEHLELLKKQISPNPRAEFIKKGYLSYSKSINENDDEVFRYEWGPTACMTVDPVVLVKIFERLTSTDPNQLKEQHERAAALRQQQLETLEGDVHLVTRGK